MSRTKFDAWIAASTADSPDNAVTDNTLVVGAVQGTTEMRVYWRGDLVQGVKMLDQVKSITHPGFTLGFPNGRTVVVDVEHSPFIFEGQRLYVHGGGYVVDYDETADKPVF